jgi:hypothetical protein
MVSSSSPAAQYFSRCDFLGRTSQWGALVAAYQLLPLPALADSLMVDSRVSQTPIIDKGFAAVRKIGDGLYATISAYHGRAGHALIISTIPWEIPSMAKMASRSGRMPTSRPGSIKITARCRARIKRRFLALSRLRPRTRRPIPRENMPKNMREGSASFMTW